MAGVPEICTRVPLMSMFAPAVYVNEPAPLIVYVVALTNAIVLVVSKPGSAASMTSPAEIVALPVFVSACARARRRGRGDVRRSRYEQSYSAGNVL